MIRQHARIRLLQSAAVPSGDGPPPSAPFPDRYNDSDDGIYRWSFERRWGPGELLCWIGLNPRGGEPFTGRRPTLAKVQRWATTWGLDGVLVINLFAYRSTDPRHLRAAAVDIIGPGNDEIINGAAAQCPVVLAAWGAGGRPAPTGCRGRRDDPRHVLPRHDPPGRAASSALRRASDHQDPVYPTYRVTARS